MAALGHASETPERLWNMGMAMTTADELAALAASARRSQVCPSTLSHLLICAVLNLFYMRHLHCIAREVKGNNSVYARGGCVSVLFIIPNTEKVLPEVKR